MSQYDPQTKCWHGPCQPPILNPAASLGQVIINLLERTPDRVFEICADSGEEFTCRDLRLRMIRAALNLTKRFSLFKGDVVCMALENSPRVTASLLGCFLLGVPAHALHAHFEESDLTHLMSITKPKLVFCNGHNFERIVSEDGTVLGINKEGEIQASYPHRFIGYYGNEQETRNFFTPDGFIRTGDIGRFDADGFLYITDRKKSMIRYQNFQIAPAQLEALIVELHGVSQAVVVGLPDPKGSSNELATALVVIGKDCSVSGEKILEHVHAKVPDYKRLRGGVYIVESLPRTGNDKIDRRQATKLARGLSQLC